MGEIADTIINGGMCQYCGECFDDEPGYPRTCLACESDGEDFIEKKPRKIECPECGKHVTEQGLSQHIAAKHQPKESKCIVCHCPFKEGDLIQAFLRCWTKSALVDAEYQQRAARNKDGVKRKHEQCSSKIKGRFDGVDSPLKEIERLNTERK